MFFSKVPWTELAGNPINGSLASATSNALFQVLSRFKFERKIEYGLSHENPSGIVAIGDECLRIRNEENWPYHYDLGKEWEDWQHCPFSFGLWIVRKSALNEKKELINQLYHAVQQSIENFSKDLRGSIAVWQSHYSQKVNPQVAYDFFSTADYWLGEQHVRSLHKFFALAFQMGLLPDIPSLKFIDFAA